MTIEQAIKEFRTPTLMITPSGTQFAKDCLQVADWLEDYQKCKADLEIYKKALEMTCHKLSEYGFCGRCGVENCKEQGCYRAILNGYLKKAREQE